MSEQINVNELRLQLYNATLKLNKLNLFEAAKWCAEALNGLSKHSNDLQPQPQTSIEIDELQDQEKFILAQTYFNCKEFERCACVLENSISGDAKFLRLYSLMIALDKRATEESDGLIIAAPISESNLLDTNYNSNDYDQMKTENQSSISNSKYTKILIESEEYLSHKENAFLFYLNGLIYRKKKKVNDAINNLYQSLLLFPYNWSCWRELIDSFVNYEEAYNFIQRVKKKNERFADSPMFHFFEIVVLQESHQRSNRLLDLMDRMSSLFPKFTFLQIQNFLIANNHLDYYTAENIFDQILIEDPLRLEDLDLFSNMLYVMEKKSKLSYIAAFASNLDPFRCETCLVLGNYYSLKSEHEKAIMYYKRALILNKTCLSAWTLMGHEFVELKNSHAAIESYRRAVDINPKDFRAWYGLGQAYEVLDMHLYALYYYQRATNLQPLDKRMWQAIGNCYDKIDQLEDAIKSFEKALAIGKISTDSNVDVGSMGEQTHMKKISINDDESDFMVEPHICYRLALLSEKLHNVEGTRKYMQLCFNQELDWGISDETSKARLWLAKDALEQGNFDEAYDLAKDLNHSNAHDVEEARAIARDARNRIKK
ncbi:CDC23 [Candida pseudojiufengensis]|uniref:CDC23 n=1 Tax=Candida pseudojiufengensis TaxID=497109 RepID=UPI0022257B74|nr:CDC23 [Candida pseudojiufengensis]KAI5962640.1 CDC23 [Candida pseudojiufengensis]